MNKKENELIFEQYITPRNANKRRSTTIVEALDHVMSLPRVERHGRTLVSEADILDVLGTLDLQQRRCFCVTERLGPCTEV